MPCSPKIMQEPTSNSTTTLHQENMLLNLHTSVLLPPPKLNSSLIPTLIVLLALESPMTEVSSLTLALETLLKLELFLEQPYPQPMETHYSKGQTKPTPFLATDLEQEQLDKESTSPSISEDPPMMNLVSSSFNSSTQLSLLSILNLLNSMSSTISLQLTNINSLQTGTSPPLEHIISMFSGMTPLTLLPL